MYRKRILTIILLAGFAGSAFVDGQDPVKEIWKEVNEERASANQPAAGIRGIIDFQQAVGMNFLYSPYTGPISGAYYAPSARMGITDRLHLHAGLAGSFYTVLPGPGTEVFTAGNNLFDLSAFAALSYQVGERLTLYGTSRKSLINTGIAGLRPVNDFSLGGTLNFGSFSIGASFHTNSGHGIYMPGMLGGSPLMYNSNGW